MNITPTQEALSALNILANTNKQSVSEAHQVLKQKQGYLIESIKDDNYASSLFETEDFLFVVDQLSTLNNTIGTQPTGLNFFI